MHIWFYILEFCYLQDFAHQFIKRKDYLAKSSTTVLVFFDWYKAESMKSRTRAKRISRKAVRYQVIDSTNICDITLIQLLSHVLTKRDLTVFLSKYLKDYFEDSNHQYVLSYENKSVSNTVGYSNELLEHDSDEADTLPIFIDTAKSNPLSECIVSSPDTDVFVLLIHNYSKFPQVLEFL